MSTDMADRREYDNCDDDRLRYNYKFSDLHAGRPVYCPCTGNWAWPPMASPTPRRLIAALCPSPSTRR